MRPSSSGLARPRWRCRSVGLTFDVEKARNGRAPFGVAGFCSTCVGRDR